MSSGVGGRVRLHLSDDEGHPMINVAFDNERLITVPEPVWLCVLGAKPVPAPYRSVDEVDGFWRGNVELSSADGTRLVVNDRWMVEDQTTVRIDRTATILAAGAAKGVRVEFRVGGSVEIEPLP